MNIATLISLVVVAHGANPLVLSAGDPAKVAQFAAEARACGYTVSTRRWADGDIMPRPASVRADTMVALADKPLVPGDRRLPCFFEAERRSLAQ